MRQLSTQSKWQWWKGVILQIVSVVLLITVGGFVQSAWGLLGLAITELMFLSLAIIYTLVKKTPLKEVFPIRKPQVRDIFGVIFMWIGGLMLGMTSIYLSAIIFPDNFGQVITGISGITTSSGFLLSFLVVAVMPPICEEALERGAVLSHFRSWKHSWAIILIIGIFFGIIHIDPIRFINTSILGAICAYLMVKKDNFLLPMLLHFMNNAFTSIISQISTSAMKDAGQGLSDTLASLQNADMSYYLGSSLVSFFIAPVLLYIGIRLMNPKFDKKSATKDELRRQSNKNLRGILIAVGCSLVMLTTGVIMMVNNPTYRETYNNLMDQYQEQGYLSDIS